MTLSLSTVALLLLAIPTAPLIDNDQVKVVRAFEPARNFALIHLNSGKIEWNPKTAGVGADSGNVIEIELKSTGPAKSFATALDPMKVDPKHFKVDLENEHIRAIHARIEPHGIAPMHEHVLNRVTVFLTDQDFRVTDAQGRVTLVKHKAGDAAWGTALTHQEENVGDRPFEVISVEFKD